MLRHKTETRPGLVTLYNIRPGNRVGQFLQPRSLHGALMVNKTHCQTYWSTEPTHKFDPIVNKTMILGLVDHQTGNNCWL